MQAHFSTGHPCPSEITSTLEAWTTVRCPSNSYEPQRPRRTCAPCQPEPLLDLPGTVHWYWDRQVPAASATFNHHHKGNPVQMLCTVPAVLCVGTCIRYCSTPPPLPNRLNKSYMVAVRCQTLVQLSFGLGLTVPSEVLHCPVLHWTRAVGPQLFSGWVAPCCYCVGPILLERGPSLLLR
jgi:hypothetical protein